MSPNLPLMRDAVERRARLRTVRGAPYLHVSARISEGGSLKHMKQELVAEILALPVPERVRLVEAIWDSISAVPEALPLTEWQKEELDRRLAEFEANPEAGSTLEEVFARIRRGS